MTRQSIDLPAASDDDRAAWRKREAALQESEQRLKTMVEASLDAIVMMDANGCVTEFNPAAEDIFGFRREDVVGLPMADTIVPERYRDAHTAGMNRFLTSGKSTVLGKRIEIEACRADGSEFMIELAIKDAKGPDGPIFIGYARDLTEQKAAEAQLIEARDRAEIANRAKASFLAMMSHEIRTPLNGVLGILDMLQDTELTSEQSAHIDVARTSGKALLQVINDVLDFSKLEAGKLSLQHEVFMVRPLVDAITSLIFPHVQEKNIALNIGIGPDVPEALYGDPGRIRQVLLNLVWNAVKFTENGHISIRIDVREPRENAVALRFSVSDTGIGVPEKAHDTLFTEFTMVDTKYSRRSSGTGLGLAISKSLVELMDGEIGFESAAGKGSTFWFNLTLVPAAPHDALDDPARELSYLLPQIGQPTVLLAEDNATNQLVIQDMLEKLGCTVDTAENGLKAVEAVVRKRYDVVFMDLSMPEMDGLEAARQIRRLESEHANVPIIALTAYALDNDRKRALEVGMNDFVSKPATRTEVARALGRCRSAQQSTIQAEQKASSTGEETFDIAVLGALLRSMRPELALKVTAKLTSDLASNQGILDRAMAGSDWPAIERSSHCLKGLAGTFGAKRLETLARTVNQIAREPNLPQTMDDVAELEAACRAAHAALPKLVKGLNVSEEAMLVQQKDAIHEPA